MSGNGKSEEKWEGERENGSAIVRLSDTLSYFCTPCSNFYNLLCFTVFDVCLPDNLKMNEKQHRLVDKEK